MIKILVTDYEGPAHRCIGDVEALTKEVLGTDVEIIYECPIRVCAQIIEKRSVQALVIPIGHGDSTTIHNLEEQMRTGIPIPIFAAYDSQRGGTMREQYQGWLRDIFGKASDGLKTSPGATR